MHRNERVVGIVVRVDRLSWPFVELKSFLSRVSRIKSSVRHFPESVSFAGPARAECSCWIEWPRRMWKRGRHSNFEIEKGV